MEDSNKKIYCKYCKYFIDVNWKSEIISFNSTVEHCKNTMINQKVAHNWKEFSKVEVFPNELNKDNNCKYFEVVENYKLIWNNGEMNG